MSTPAERRPETLRKAAGGAGKKKTKYAASLKPEAELLEQFGPRIRGMARRIFPKRLQAGASPEDLEQAGGMALVRCARRYDDQRPDATPFGGYFQQRLRGAMLDVLRVEYGHAVARQQDETGRADGSALEEIGEWVTRPGEVWMGAADSADQPDAAACHEQTRRLLERASLAVLDRRERRIAHKLFVDGLTLREAGRPFGLGESRVCQIRADILRKLREELQGLGIHSLGDTL